MVAPTPSNGYSARVRLELHVAGNCIPLAQIGGDRLVLKRPHILPGTTGKVLALIDEHQQHWTVTWPASDSPRQIVPAQYQNAGE